MPWKETSVLDQRLQFIATFLSQELSMADLCREFGISRKAGYKLIHKYQALGPDGLLDLSRAPHTHPNATSVAVEQHIIALRADHPTWGPRKLRAALLRTAPETRWPAASTVGQILRRNGLTTPRRRRTPRTLTMSATPIHADSPNAVWCADFKGCFSTKDGRRCHPFTITDAYSRMLLRCQALTRPDKHAVKPICIAAFREYGLPAVMRTDNGPPFSSVALGGLSQLSVWWIKLGIHPQRIQPGHPEQNGSHERMHRTLKEEATIPPQANISLQQKAFDRFRNEYNNLRPHEAIGQQTPASMYVRSPREYPLRTPEIHYPEHILVRHVRRDGYIRWHGHMLFVSEALAGEPVGLDQLDDRHFALYFGPIPLAILDGHTNTWLPRKAAASKLLSLWQEGSI